MSIRKQRLFVIFVFLFVFLALALAGCDIPQDSHGTLQRVRGGTMRVGIAFNAPWTIDEERKPGGIEVELLRAFAKELDAEIVWAPGTVPNLLEALERYELDVVVAGLTKGAPGLGTVGLTNVYLKVNREKHVMAVPPGENGWLVRLERFLFYHHEEAQRLLQREGAQ